EEIAAAPACPPALLIPGDETGCEGEEGGEGLGGSSFGPVLTECSSVQNLGDYVCVIVDTGIDARQRHGELVGDHPGLAHQDDCILYDVRVELVGGCLLEGQRCPPLALRCREVDEAMRCERPTGDVGLRAIEHPSYLHSLALRSIHRCHQGKVRQ